MKFASILLPLLCSSTLASSGPADPAVEWLRAVAAGRTDPAEGTALSKDLTDQRREAIRQQLTRLRTRLRPDDLRALEDKQDGDLAGVIVSQVTGYDAATVQVHAVAMVRREGKWLPAPSPASFDGAGLLFHPELRQRARALEEWMIRSRGEQFARLRENIFSTLVDEMKRTIDPDLLRDGEPEKMAQAFVDACQKRSIPAALALTGGLEQPLPGDWSDTVQTVTRALGGGGKHPGWRLLAAPEVLRAVVHSEQTKRESMVSLVCLDPGATPLRPRAIHLTLEKSESQRWRILLPETLDLSSLDARNATDTAREDAAIDADLIRRFPEKLRALIPARPLPESRAVLDLFLAALRQPSLDAVVPHLDLSGDPGRAIDTLVHCALQWRELHQPRDLRLPLALDFRESGPEACAIVHRFSAVSPVVADLSAFFFRRDDHGWLADADLTGVSRGPQRDDETLSIWLKETRARFEDAWASGLMLPLENIAPGSAPAEDAARETAAAWRKAIAAGDPAAMLALSAFLPEHHGMDRALRNTGRELISRVEGEILAVRRAGHWAGVSVRVENSSGEISHPFHLVAATPDGPRILPEFELFAPLTRSREHLNTWAFKRIAGLLPAEASGELKTLFDHHCELAAADRAARPDPISE